MPPVDRTPLADALRRLSNERLLEILASAEAALACERTRVATLRAVLTERRALPTLDEAATPSPSSADRR